MRQGVYFDDVTIGTDIPIVSKGPLTTAHVVRWSAAMENWAPIHYDWRYATQHDGLPDVLVNGSWKQHVMMQALTERNAAVLRRVLADHLAHKRDVVLGLMRAGQLHADLAASTNSSRRDA